MAEKQKQHALSKPLTVTIVRTFATAEEWIAGRTRSDVRGQLAEMDGAELPSEDRKAILAALAVRTAERDAKRDAVE
jgi:hypothetical protein